MNDEDPADEGGRRLGLPDISRHREGNTGIPYATRLEGTAPGPEVVVAALVHGNEVCGAHALDHLLTAGPRPRRGAVTAVFCNPAAYHRVDAAQALPTRYVDEDFNRVWAPDVLDGPRDSVELRRARAIRPLIDHCDLLLDLHSMLASDRPMILAGIHEKGRRLAAGVGVPGVVVADGGHAAGPRMRDYGGFADPASPKAALLVECGRHTDPASGALAREALYRFLRHADVVDPDDVAAFVGGAPPPQEVIEVTHVVTPETERFRFVRPLESLAPIAEAGTLIAVDDGREVRTPYPGCVPVMPARHPVPGGTAVRLGRKLSSRSGPSP